MGNFPLCLGKISKKDVKKTLQIIDIRLFSGTIYLLTPV